MITLASNYAWKLTSLDKAFLENKMREIFQDNLLTFSARLHRENGWKSKQRSHNQNGQKVCHMLQLTKLLSKASIST